MYFLLLLLHHFFLIKILFIFFVWVWWGWGVGVGVITPARAARSAARRAYNNRVPIPRARARQPRQPRFDSSMQYCIRSLISITNVQKCCKRANVCASLLLWHFKTIWIENICLPFIEVHCSYQQKLFHFAHRGFSNFLISTQNFNKWRPNVGINILVLTNA